MNIVTLDYETYYDDQFSLSKLSTEDYVCDERYETIMVSIKKNDGPVIWHSGTHDSITNWLFDNGVHKAGVVCHNHIFDGMVSKIHHDLNPPIMFCTRFMAKAIIQPYVRTVSLDSCLKYINAPVQKGNFITNMKGVRRTDMSKSEMRAYADYCCDDTDGTYFLFKWLLERLPREELAVIDQTLRMYIQPQFIADAKVFEKVRDNDALQKQKLLDSLPPELQRADLMSNIKFAIALQNLGIDPPTKLSPTTNKETWAFAKNDAGWRDLQEEYADDEVVAPILAARLGLKSTIVGTRAERLRQIGERHKVLRVPLVYYSALTGRYGGTDGTNMQNLSRVKRNKDGTPTTREQLRFGLRAPKGYSVLAVDAAQIEARINAWVSGCNVLVSQFANKEDPYAAFATRIFNRKITKQDPTERFVGKTCILGLGYGMGAKTLQGSLRNGGLPTPLDECENYVDTYRSEYREIPALWNLLTNSGMEVLRSGGKLRVGPCMVEKARIQLPNGMYLTYDNMRYIKTDKYEGWAYSYGGITRTLSWGGKIVENMIQALARIKITEAMRHINDELGWRAALQAHDELVYIVPTIEAPAIAKEMEIIMSRPPEWGMTLPLAAEAGFGPTYGDCK